MRYLGRKRKARVLHLWRDSANDTFCRMWSTGGLRKAKYEVFDTNDSIPICTMCQNVERQIGLAEMDRIRERARLGT